MKVLQINLSYDEGSTGKIVANIHSRLFRDGHESYVVFGLGENQVKDDPIHLYRTTSNSKSLLYRRISRVTGLRYNTAYFETFKLLRHIDRIKPDVVHLHCMNCAYVQPYILLKHLGKKGYPVLVTHHADVTITANCDYSFECNKWLTGCGKCATNITEKRSFFLDATHRSWKQMQKAFGYVKNLYAAGVSDWMSDRVRKSPFFKETGCKTVLNGLDIDSFTYRGLNVELRQKFGIKDNEKIILHVTPNFSAPIKGGRFVLDIAKRIPEVKVVIVGIKDFERTGLPTNIIPVANVSSKEMLSRYYSMADLTLLTSYRESFSMVTAESLCCGTPVVGFKAGAPETITIPEYSEFVDYGNVNELEKAIKNSLEQNYDKQTISDIARNKYDAETMYRNYLEYYKSIVSNSNKIQ